MQMLDVEEPFRQGDHILRPVRPWTSSVHALLAALRRHGFAAAPLPAGFDAVWEKVTYLPGTTGDLDDNVEMRSELALRSAASLLRHYHDCSALFLRDLATECIWQLPARTPREVICHGDFAPYNVVLNGGEVTGIIDFETAHPAPRCWDLAYAVYRWAPLSSGIGVESLDGAGQPDPACPHLCRCLWNVGCRTPLSARCHRRAAGGAAELHGAGGGARRRKIPAGPQGRT